MSPKAAPPRSSSDWAGDTGRSDILWRALEANKNFFTAWMVIPLDMVSQLPFPIQSQLSFAIVTSSRLLALSDTNWDAAAARKEFDMTVLTERLAAFYDEADRVSSLNPCKRKFWDDTRSMMRVVSEKLRWIGTWYSSRQVLADEQSGSLETAELDATLQYGDFDVDLWHVFWNDNVQGGGS